MIITTIIVIYVYVCIYIYTERETWFDHCLGARICLGIYTRRRRKKRKGERDKISIESTTVFYRSISRWIRQIISKSDADDFISRTVCETSGMFQP